MPMIAKAGAGDYTPPPAGTYLATCCDVFSGGWWANMNGVEVEKVKIRFCFWEQLDDDDPRWQDPEFVPELLYADVFETFSVGEKANLRKILKSWRGVDLTEEEVIVGFDVERVLGAHALITVEHKPKTNGQGVNVQVKTVMKPMRGQAGPGIPANYVRDAESEWPMANAYPQGCGGKRVENPKANQRQAPQRPQQQAAPARPAAPRPAQTAAPARPAQAPRPANDRWNQPAPPAAAAPEPKRMPNGAPPPDAQEFDPSRLEEQMEEEDDLPF